MEIIPISTNTSNYSVYIGTDLRFEIANLLKKSYKTILIVTDETVGSLYLEDVLSCFTNQNQKAYTYTFPSGEASKNIEEYWKIQTFAIEHGLDRHSLLIALGGGVVGDLGGFVAATFMRGIDYIQVPTTILAHDSSVGGKVAINHPLGKNLVGSFYQPKAVIYDVTTLETLSLKEKRSGFAEIIKHACIQDDRLLKQLMSDVTSLESIDNNILLHSIKRGIEIKANIVEADEQETGIRSYLNFGHTLAHAIESEAGYGEITHGEAVVIGMLFAIQMSEAIYQHNPIPKTFKSWLDTLGYPITTVASLSRDALVNRMKSDKKNREGNINMVLLKDVASPELVPITEETLASQLEIFQKEVSLNDQRF